MKPDADLWVVVPAYNECSAIAGVMDRLSSLGYSVIVVDDGSRDGTAKEVLSSPVVLLRHVSNLGQGAALQTGIAYALRFPETRYIVTFDADGQHDAVDIQRLVAPLREGTHDVVLGSRFLMRESAINLRASKRVLLRSAVAFTRLTTGLGVTDTHNGLRAFTAEAASRIAITQNRMAHASDLLSQIAALGLRWCEVPVSIRYTPYSMSKGQTLLESVNILWDMVRGRMR